jgi:RimJ/RimL family protein N-acetyltransferase
MSVRLRGERVLLRPFKEEEFDDVWEREKAPDASDEARKNHRDRLWRSGEWNDPGELRLAIEADGELVGDCQVRASTWAMPPGVGEIGIQLYDEARGKGYGTDVLRTLCPRLFEEDGLHRVQISTEVENAAMRRAAEKAGFTFEGILRGFWREPDGVRDYAMYGRTLDDHRAGGSH